MEDSVLSFLKANERLATQAQPTEPLVIIVIKKYI
jgi:hypothetical protein